MPLLYPPVPPLVDLLGHMGRYRVELDLGSSPWLQQYYDFHWAPIGNLGVDLLVMPLAKLIGLEPAVKLIVLAIPPLTVAGFLWVAREVHHRLPPTAHVRSAVRLRPPVPVRLRQLSRCRWRWRSSPSACGCGSARLGQIGLRAVLFVPISFVVFFAHTFGWGMLGLLCFLGRGGAPARPRHRLVAGRASARRSTPSVMALPVLIMLAWRSEIAGGMTAGWFNWDCKLEWLDSALRDRWELFDIGIAGAGRRRCSSVALAQPAPDPVAQPRLLGAGAARRASCCCRG